MAASPLHVGLVGLGLAGAQLHLPALRRVAGVVVVGAADPDPASHPRAGDVPVHDDWRALLAGSARPDAVVVASPPATHAEVALAALSAGCHVYLEKPMTTSLGDARRVAEAAVENRRVLQVGFAYRFHPLWRRVRALVSRGRLRPPLRATGRFAALRAGEGWAHPTIEVGCHHVDALSWLTGAPPTAVHVRGDTVEVSWPGGTTLAGDYSAGADGDRVELVDADSRTCVLDRLHGVRLTGTATGPADRLPSPALVRARLTGQGWERSFEWAHAAFARTCRGEAPLEGAGAEDGIAVVAYGEAVLASVAGGDVPQEIRA